MTKSYLVIACILWLLGSCCNEDFIIPEKAPPPPTFDTKDGAIDLTGIMNSCSADAAYTTVGATADGLPNACFAAGPKHNRWFKFQAPISNSGSIYIKVGGVLGTQIRTILTLYDTDGVTERRCGIFGGDTDTVSFYDSGWTAGAYYYFTVDVADDGSVGSFTICLTDTD